MTDSLQRILDNDLCLGCGACAAVLPKGRLSMAISDNGFLRPVRRNAEPLSAQENVAIQNICSGLSLDHQGSPSGVPYHSVWGPILRVATGHARDPKVRFRGSSGGVLTAICDWLVQSKKVDFVVCTAADLNDPIGNKTGARATAAEIIAAAGSRYGPSSPLENMETYLARNQKFAFVGKPCDVAALRRMARRDPRIDQLIPYKLSFFCAGVPSRQGTLALLADMGVAESDLATFRYRGDGWPGEAKAVRLDGTEVRRDYNSSWGNVLNRYLQHRCKICVDGTGEFADIACADAWYGERGYPDFAERDGRSLIVARSQAGLELLMAVDQAEVLETQAFDIGSIMQIQPYQDQRKRNALARIIGLRLAGRAAPSFVGFGLGRLALRTGYIGQLRNCFGMFKRARRKKNA